MLLVVSLLPGLSEILENVEHILHDGHLPHGQQHESTKYAESHADGLDEEHGCTPMAHLCGCHASAPAILAENDIGIRRLMFASEGRPFAAEQIPTSRANAPPTPPPIA